MDVFVARQPVFDEKKDVYGYELLFRAGFEKYYATADAMDVLGGDKATVDFMAFVNFAELTDGKRGFVNFNRELLMKEFPSVLPAQMMTVGLPADVQADDEVVRLCRGLKDAGCLVALNDATATNGSDQLLDLADIAKVNFAASDADQRRALCERLTAQGVKMLAQNVESNTEFSQALEWGYSYFHGTFFSKPVIRPERQIPPNKIVHMQVLKEVNKAELPLQELEQLIKQDVSMTYKLLRFMNSVWFGLRYEVRSIKHALVLLGPKEIRKWASMLVVADTGADKPQELLRRSLARAHMAERIAPLVGMDDSAAELFLMGMFSCIDALLDVPMEATLDELALNEKTRQALLGAGGPYRSILDVILAYEQGDWKRFSTAAGALKLDEKAIPDLFWESLRWGKEALEAV